MKKPREFKEIEGVKGRILDVALDIIVLEGYGSLTMRKLASRLSMTAPNIYNYYKSKDEIYIHLVIRGFDMLNNILKDVILRYKEPDERARQLAKAYLAFGLKHSGYYDIMFTYPTPKYNDYVGTALEKLSEVEYRISMEIVDFVMREIAAFTGKKEVDESVRVDLIGVWSLLHGMVSLYNSRIINYTTVNPEDMYNSLIDMFLSKLNIN
ncbi:MAG TPA: TetR/AcrR family transcriptional regulator [Desulfomonilia bacterium]|jgi:AcrR family transcriptional regulator